MILLLRYILLACALTLQLQAAQLSDASEKLPIKKISLANEPKRKEVESFFAHAFYLGESPCFESTIPDLNNSLCNVVRAQTPDTPIIGAIAAYQNKKNPLHLTIHSLAIDEYHRRKGYGSLLLKQIEKRARKRKYTHISLYSILEAIPFYKQQGFVNINPQDKDDDDCVLIKEL